MLEKPKMTEQFVAGLVGAPFGLKGFVKVRPLSGEIGHLLKLRSVIVRQAEQKRTLQIEACKPQPPALLVKFAGFDSPEAVKELRGAELLVDRGQAAPLQEGEFYIEDLRGLEVRAGKNGAPVLGHITDIIEGGGGDLVEIRLAATGELKLVPFRNAFFAEISLEDKRAVLLNQWILE